MNFSNNAVVMCSSITVQPRDTAFGLPRTHSANPFAIAKRARATDTAVPAMKQVKVQGPNDPLFFVDGIQTSAATGNVNSQFIGVDVGTIWPGTSNAANSEDPISRSADLDVGQTASPRTGRIRYRHGEKANEVFVDGSVRAFDQQRLTQRDFVINY